ncbi:hypothetical protein DL98DRAFT_282964 [Cadophora sp. DSE1049]|nr:hypothetical protein DL98DRAFT_282964 [Cadophora sp. DSE1049]
MSSLAKPDVNMEFRFDMDETCISGDNMDMRISFVMIYSDKVYVFRGKKTASLEEGPGPWAEQKASWDALGDPQWDDDFEPESSSVDEHDYYGKILKERRKKSKREVKHRIIARPAPRKRVVANSIPGGRGFNQFIELPPPWTINLSGFWKLDAKHLAKHFGADRNELELNFTMANNPPHTKVGRQLWARFRFGPKVYGVMRFCPAPTSPEDRKTPCH